MNTFLFIYQDDEYKELNIKVGGGGWWAKPWGDVSSRESWRQRRRGETRGGRVPPKKPKNGETSFMDGP